MTLFSPLQVFFYGEKKKKNQKFRRRKKGQKAEWRKGGDGDEQDERDSVGAKYGVVIGDRQQRMVEAGLERVEGQCWKTDKRAEYRNRSSVNPARGLSIALCRYKFESNAKNGRGTI